MIPGSANPLLLASAAQAGAYSISRSVRLNSADSAYLSRTPASAGNRKTYTWSGWVKRSKLGSGTYYLFTAVDGVNADILGLEVDSLYWNNAYSGAVKSIDRLRDPSAWYHIVFAIDSTQATDADRVKMYVNNRRITAFSSSLWPSLNRDFAINNTVAHKVGQYFSTNSSDFYLADIHFIDGQALDPTSFGEFDDNGIWQPKAYTGTYPGNSFHLTFSDNSTAASLGDDSSNNGNNWTVNNISVATGAGNDSLVDVPTNGTEADTGLGNQVKGNYCTWNPLKKAVGGSYSFANGNLEVINVLNVTSTAVGTIFVTSGKWYWEISFSSNPDPSWDSLGIQSADAPDGPYPGGYDGLYGYLANGNKISNNNGFTGTSYGAVYAGTDIIGVAFDADAGAITFYKNGVSQGQAFSGITSSRGWAPYVGDYSNAVTVNSWIGNFGQRPFAYPVSGYKSLCTANLPSTTITTSGSYTGNGVADGPFVFLNGVPTAMTIGGNSVTFGTDADKLSNGFKIRTTSTTFNQNASTYNYSITSTGDPFKTARAQAN